MQTGLSSWVHAIAKALQQAGIDADRVMRSLDMDPEKLGDLEHRYSQEQVTALWIAAGKETGDPHFGLKVARFIRPSTFHVVGYAMSCSANLRRAGQRFARFSRIVSDAAQVEFEEGPEGAALSVELNPQGKTPIYHTIDTILAGFHLLCEWILGDAIVPISVELRHPAPPDVNPYRDVFHIEVGFLGNRNRIVYPNAILDRPIPAANEEMAYTLDDMATSHIAKTHSQRFTSLVRQALIGQLPKGVPNRQQTAQMIGVTERTLLRRLGDEDTTFQEVLERLRESLALDYLRRPELTTEEISFLLGFSSSSSFSRAFMRWTGSRPSDWRERTGEIYDENSQHGRD